MSDKCKIAMLEYFLSLRYRPVHLQEERFKSLVEQGEKVLLKVDLDLVEKGVVSDNTLW